MATSLGRGVRTVVTAHEQTEGGGFMVRRPFPTYNMDQVDPFIMFDHMLPTYNHPHEAIGAPDHPHRGFETVTYMLQGSFQHLDSFGHKGTIRAGGVQWMTAGSGLVHSEMPSDELLEKGGMLEGFQIWVNLPSHAKLMKPRYQELDPEQIPTATSPDGRVTVKVITGESLGVKAKIDTITPIMMVDVNLQPHATFTQSIPSHWNALVYTLTGAGLAGKDQTSIKEGQMALIDTDVEATSNNDPHSQFTLTTGDQALHVLLLAGQPINEPISRYGPFVMNTRKQIQQAFEDYQAGKMGELEGGEERMAITDNAKRIKQERLAQERRQNKSNAPKEL